MSSGEYVLDTERARLIDTHFNYSVGIIRSIRLSVIVIRHSLAIYHVDETNDTFFVLGNRQRS